MAVDGYMWFQAYTGDKYMDSESQVDPKKNDKDLFWDTYKFGECAKNNCLFEIEDFSFDIEQTLNIGSQSTGAGAGKVTFNPFSITRKIDKFSPVLFQNSCSGVPYQKVALGLRKSSGGETAGAIYLTFIFRLVAVKTISWSYDDESPKETVTFEYGGLQLHYARQEASGKFEKIIPSGWNRVRNVKEDSFDAAVIK